MKTTNLYSFILLCVMLGAIMGCSKEFATTEPDMPNPTEPDMVFVQVGTSEPEQDFSIGKYPVTQAQWTAVMGTTLEEFAQPYKYSSGGRFAGVGDNYPMYYVSWDDALEYIARLNAMTGKNYRLPTAKEWEYAARGGNQGKGYKYSGSNDIDEVAWYYFNIPSNKCNKPGYGTQPVGLKKPNELGIYDMSGNVWEWCSDYDPRCESNVACYTRVVLGGSWDCNFGGLLVRNNIIHCAGHEHHNYAYGFRVACSPE